MELIRVRSSDETPELTEHRERLTAMFAEDYGQVVGAEIEQQVRRVVEDAVRMVSTGVAVFREYQVIQSALKIAERPNEFREEVLSHNRFKELIEQTVHEYPLVVIGPTGTFTTQEMLAYEQEMVALAGAREPHHVISDAIVRAAIASKEGISEEQIAAVIAATRSPTVLTVIEGTAGAGKSFTMEAVRLAYEKAGYDVKGTAISWVAATVLGNSAKIGDSRALAGLLYDMEGKYNRGAEFFHRDTLLVVDEAGMVDTVQMAKLLRFCSRSKYKIKVVLTGDTLQVVPVAAGAAMETIVARFGTTRIDTIRRQVLASHRTAIHQLSKRQSGLAMHTLLQQECFRWAETQEDQISMVVRDYVSYRRAHPNRSALVLAADNNSVAEINTRIRDAYKRLGLIHSRDVTVRVTDTKNVKEASFSVGDEIVLRGNNPKLPVYKIDPSKSPVREKDWELQDRVGVYNRNYGRIVGIRKSRDPLGSYDFIVDLGGEIPGRVIINSETFHKQSMDRGVRALPMVHNYATTVYASQGQTVDQVFLVDSGQIDFRTAYVGMSRHRHNVFVYMDENDLHNRLDRIQHKKSTKAARNNPQLEMGVVRGRYTRKEMLQEAAANWAKDKQNPTALLYESRARLETEDKAKKLDINKLSELRSASAAEDNGIWDADLRDAVFSEAVEPMQMGESWRKGRSLDSTALIHAAERLVRLNAWMKEPELLEDSETLLEAMKRRRPAAGIWDLTGAEDLAEELFELSKDMRAAIEERKSLGQEVLDRTQAGDALSKSMETIVKVFTEQYPTVNIEKVLELPVPLQDAEIIHETEVDMRRAATPVDIIPVPEPLPGQPEATAQEVHNAGLLSRFLAHLTPKVAPVPPTPEVDRYPGGRPPQPRDPFAHQAPEAEAVVAPPRKGGFPEFMQAAAAWLRDGPQPTVTVPFYPEKPPIGKILEGGKLSFEGVPQTELPPDQQANGPSAMLLEAGRGLWWTRGRYNEPRILARSRDGAILARYALDGRCVAGIGYPPMLLNPTPGPRTPIYIVAGPREMAWMTEAKLRKGGEPELVPHVVWAAAGADLGQVAAGMRHASEVVIVRSKFDAKQADWAEDLEKDLRTRWNLNPRVSPPLPAPTVAPVEPVRPAQRRAPGRSP
jgi:hypothetical protein